jgi:hypothetical protein
MYCTVAEYFQSSMAGHCNYGSFVTNMGNAGYMIAEM